MNSDNWNRISFKFTLSILALVVLSTVFAGCLSNNTATSNNQKSSTNNNPIITATTVSIGETTTTVQQVQNTVASAVPNGTYSNLEQYSYHSGVNTVNITVTVENDIVTAASVTGINVDPYSQYTIGNFNSALPSTVVGQKIESIQLPQNVAGSSLTTAAFQSYINSIVSTDGHPA